jgi:hypothetical protein
MSFHDTAVTPHLEHLRASHRDNKVLIKPRPYLISQSEQPLDYGMDDRGSMVQFPAGGGNFFSPPPRSERLCGPSSLLSNGYQGALSLGIKQPERKADQSLPSSVEVKEWVQLYLHSSNTPSWSGAQVQKSTGTNLPSPFAVIYCKYRKGTVKTKDALLPKYYDIRA